MKDRLKLGRNVYLSAVLVSAIALSVITIASASAPNPGHTWAEVGDVLVTAPQGGTGLSTIAAGSVLAANALDTLSAVTSTSGLKVLQISGTTVSWAGTTGTSNAVFSNSPTLVGPTLGIATATSVNGLTPTSLGTGFSISGGTTSKTLTVTGDATISGTPLSNPMTTQGDIISGGSSGTPSRLAIGAANQALLTNSGATAPVWGASMQSLMTTTGDVVYASSANTPARLGIGGANQALLTNSGATAPVWGASLQSLMTTTGDIVYASSANTPARLADVAAGSFLRSGGTSTAPAWSTITVPNAASQGDIWYGSASNVISALGVGTSGQFLKTLGAGANPAWGTIGGVASISATSAALSNSEASVLSYSVPANTLAAGTTFRIKASGVGAGVGTFHFKVYIGSGAAGTTANQALAVDVTGTSSAANFKVEALVTIRATGAGGTASILGSGLAHYGNATVANVQTTTAATGTNFATTATNNLYLDFLSSAGATTATFYNAVIELVKP